VHTALIFRACAVSIASVFTRILPTTPQSYLSVRQMIHEILSPFFTLTCLRLGRGFGVKELALFFYYMLSKDVPSS
jgi:hypothetical protein